MSYQKPYINPLLFTKPPPNFNKKSSSNWNNFKVPTSPIANNNSRKNYSANNTSRTNTQTSGNYAPNFQSTSRNYAAHSNNHSSGSPTQRNYSNLQTHQSGSQNLHSHFGDSQNVQSRFAAGSQNVQPRPNRTQTQSGSNNYTNSLQLLGINYQNAPPPNIVSDFKNKPPPNYKMKDVDVSQKKQYKDLVFNPVGLIPGQPFKPNVPPPNIRVQNSSLRPQYERNRGVNPLALQGNTISRAVLEEAKVKYFMQMYRYRQVADPQSLLAYSTAPVQPSPPNYPPPQQPPLPPGAPPLKPPPPPPPLSPSQSQESNTSKQNYQNRAGGSSLGSSAAPLSKQYHQRQKQNPAGNVPSQQSTAYNSQSNKSRAYSLKRKHEATADNRRFNRKKKKPLSQAVPRKINWSMEDAKKALDVETEYNKRSRRQGLVIKFPDQELSRDIVSNFHSSIESVHFQQPSMARYCFVTLVDSADPQTVIKQLNQIPFGLGYLSAEYKKDREDEHNIKPSDIDPLTLYVGNLSQEITKEDMTKNYPKAKRIDIGYAKKMKFTRYAFVSFYNAEDSIEAFMMTHSSQLYSKSLIVRFRRLCGTVGLPGDGDKDRERIKAMRDAPSTPIPEPINNNNSWDIDVSHWDRKDARITDMHPFSDDDDEQETKMQLFERPGFNQLRFGEEDFDAPYTYASRNVVIKEERNDEVAEINGYQDSDLGYGESDDQYSNISNPLTPETPSLPEHCDETNSQSSNTKREQTKQEDYFPPHDPTRFRILQGTINLRPSRGNLRLDSTLFESESPSKDADNSVASVKQEGESDFSAHENVGRHLRNAAALKNFELSTEIILPKPIVIKREQEGDQSDDNDETDTHTDANVELPSGNGNSTNSPDLPGGCDERNVSKDGSNEPSDNNKEDSSETQPSDNNKEVSSETQLPVGGGLEKSSERCDSGAETFDWDVDMNYPVRDIKAELEFDDAAGDDNSSDEEMDIHSILKKQKKVTKEKNE